MVTCRAKSAVVRSDHPSGPSLAENVILKYLSARPFSSSAFDLRPKPVIRSEPALLSTSYLDNTKFGYCEDNTLAKIVSPRKSRLRLRAFRRDFRNGNTFYVIFTRCF